MYFDGFDSYRPEPPDEVWLFSSSLLSKWGFHDGDQLDWLYEFGKFSKHEVLIEVVKRKMLPVLDQKVEIVEIGTCHNPCRASTIDGDIVEHLWYDPDSSYSLTPEYVIVKGSEILEIAQELLEKSSSE